MEIKILDWALEKKDRRISWSVAWAWTNHHQWERATRGRAVKGSDHCPHKPISCLGGSISVLTFHFLPRATGCWSLWHILPRRHHHLADPIQWHSCTTNWGIIKPSLSLGTPEAVGSSLATLKPLRDTWACFRVTAQNSDTVFWHLIPWPNGACLPMSRQSH